jgi:chromosome segregation ATPase
MPKKRVLTIEERLRLLEEALEHKMDKTDGEDLEERLSDLGSNHEELESTLEDAEFKLEEVSEKVEDHEGQLADAESRIDDLESEDR